MRIKFNSTMVGIAALAGALALTFAIPAPAQAAKSKSVKTEAKFVSYDASAKTITVKVVKTGKKPKNKALIMKKGKEATFKVKPEGSILTRTSVTLNGQKADITDIPEKKTINIYWVQDQADESVRFARKIDMILSDKELEARDAARLEAAKASGKLDDE
jgi:hypothetical protein